MLVLVHTYVHTHVTINVSYPVPTLCMIESNTCLTMANTPQQHLEFDTSLSEPLKSPIPLLCTDIK